MLRNDLLRLLTEKAGPCAQIDELADAILALPIPGTNATLEDMEEKGKELIRHALCPGCEGKGLPICENCPQFNSITTRAGKRLEALP
jgi:hypothetical protein